MPSHVEVIIDKISRDPNNPLYSEVSWRLHIERLPIELPNRNETVEITFEGSFRDKMEDEGGWMSVYDNDCEVDKFEVKIDGEELEDEELLERLEELITSTATGDRTPYDLENESEVERLEKEISYNVSDVVEDWLEDMNYLAKRGTKRKEAKASMKM